MSASKEFQKIVIDTLRADSGVAALVSTRIYDNPPANPVHPYISMGPSYMVPTDAEDINSRDETLQIDVWSRDSGNLHPCKAIVDAIYDALHDAAIAMPDPYALESIRVVLVRVFDDPDGVTAHGVVQVEGSIELD